MFPPGRKACPAGSRILCFSSAAPSLLAIILFIIRPIIGLTEMGLMLSVLSTCPPFLGSPVTIAFFSYSGMSLAFRESIAIFLRSSSDLVG